MAKGLDVEMIREHYRRLTDKEFLFVVRRDARGLTPEALQVVKDEIALRNLSNDLSFAIEAQNKNYTIDELDVYCRLIEAATCPECHKNTGPLTAGLVYQTMSFIVLTHHSKKLCVRCASCIRSENAMGLGLSLFIGWWGIPWGPIRTVGSIVNFFKTNALLKKPAINDVMRGFVYQNIGLFTVYKDDPEAIEIILTNLYKNNTLDLGLELV